MLVAYAIAHSIEKRKQIKSENRIFNPELTNKQVYLFAVSKAKMLCRVLLTSGFGSQRIQPKALIRGKSIEPSLDLYCILFVLNNLYTGLSSI